MRYRADVLPVRCGNTPDPVGAGVAPAAGHLAEAFGSELPAQLRVSATQVSPELGYTAMRLALTTRIFPISGRMYRGAVQLIPMAMKLGQPYEQPRAFAQSVRRVQCGYHRGMRN